MSTFSRPHTVIRILYAAGSWIPVATRATAAPITTSPPRHPRADASCHAFTAYTSFCPPSTMSSDATRNRMSPAITRSFPSVRSPEKIETASANAPVRTAYSKDRVRWLISPDTFTRRRCSEGGSFASAAARGRARNTGRAWRRGASWRASRTPDERPTRPRRGEPFETSTLSP